MTELDDDQKQNLRLEYEKTQDMAVHYDIINWTIGSILIAGIFLMIGVVGDKIQLYPNLALFSFIGLLVWRLYYHRHKGIQELKFKRLQEIENELNLNQHLRIKKVDTDGMDIDGEKVKARKILFIFKLGVLSGIKGDRYADSLTVGIPAALLIARFLSN